ncbi:hypothetical protein [Streptomyces angustmyceticus]|uniref:hypothetical protein n=1 Tax=Streptomyces angustmyceticus TaxID=285578 RepID=UPI00344D255B
MRSHRALAVLDQLRSLAADDASLLTQAKGRLARAEKELSAARSAFNSANTRAEVSQRVVRGAEELLPAADQSSAADGDRTAGVPEGRPRTIAQEVVAFLRSRLRAAREEITHHMETTRPDVKPASLRRELSRMVTNGTLTRTGGVYAMASGDAGGDA